MWQLKSGVLLIAATLIGASCGGASAVPTAPGTVSDQGAGVAQVVQPSGANTPMISSDVHGRALISTSATSTNCQGQPGDPLGLDRPSVTLPAPVPIVQFGSRLTEVRSASHNLRGTTFVGSVRAPRLPANCLR
jgi:hypothetical protein